MKKDYSPEEKLLRLIKSTGKKAQPKEDKPSPRIQPPEEPLPKLDQAPTSQKQIKQEAKAAKPISIVLPLKLKRINTRTLNLTLLTILVGLLLYFTYDIFYTSFYEKGGPSILAGEETSIPRIEKEETLEIKPYSHYSSSIENRNIFTPQQVETEAVIAGPILEEIRANLSLIGIIAGERPQAIIEDRKSAKSHFLYKGGTVGEAKVVEILDDSVIMEYQGQRFELVL